MAPECKGQIPCLLVIEEPVPLAVSPQGPVRPTLAQATLVRPPSLARSKKNLNWDVSQILYSKTFPRVISIYI